jgi:hypothetical protein
VAIVAALEIGYGFLIEFYHGILLWRSFGLADLFWNTLGVLFVLTSLRLSKLFPGCINSLIP